MTILKVIISAVVGIIALLLLIALILDTNMQIESEITVNQPRNTVFNYLRHLKNQDHYSKWMMMDPEMEKSYRGEDGTEGFVYAWESDMQNVGVGEQEIISITDGEKIETEIRFQKPFISTDRSYMITESVDDNRTKVTFGYNGKMNYPTNLMIPVFRKKIAADMSENLENLKNELE